jgi:hypothetical protein
VQLRPAGAGIEREIGHVRQLELAYGVRRVAELGLQRLDEIRSANGQVEFRLVEHVDARALVTDAARALQHSAI